MAWHAPILKAAQSISAIHNAFGPIERTAPRERNRLVPNERRGLPHSRRRPLRLSPSARSCMPHWAGPGLTGPTQDGRIELTTASTGCGRTSIHPRPSPSTSTISRPARTPEPTRSQRQGYRFRFIGVSIPARRRSVPAREFRCRTTRQRPNRQAPSPRVLRRKDLCPQRSACGAPENFHLSKARRRPCSALAGGATSARPGQIEPFHEKRPPLSTPPSGAASTRSSRTPNTGRAPSFHRHDPSPQDPAGLNCKFGATTANHPAPSRSKPTQPGRTVPTERARTAGRWFGGQSSTARRPHPR